MSTSWVSHPMAPVEILFVGWMSRMPGSVSTAQIGSTPKWER
ncbi:hypothetical protein [Rhodococcus opacus]|nr:hypothetical protein [Rhodococcus opacus]